MCCATLHGALNCSKEESNKIAHDVSARLTSILPHFISEVGHPASMETGIQSI